MLSDALIMCHPCTVDILQVGCGDVWSGAAAELIAASDRPMPHRFAASIFMKLNFWLILQRGQFSFSAVAFSLLSWTRMLSYILH